MFTNWRTTGVEGVGGGKMFQQYLRTDARVRFQDSSIANPKGRVLDKAARFDAEIAPWLESAVIRISDEKTPYLEALCRLCDNFFDLDKHDSAWDAGDALYHAAKLIPTVLREVQKESLAPEDVNDRGSLGHPMAFSWRK